MTTFVAASKDSAPTSTKDVHHMPFALEKSVANARIDEYFNVTRSANEDGSVVKDYTINSCNCSTMSATVRGRPLNGAPVAAPDSMAFYVVQPIMDKTGQQAIVDQRAAIIAWNLDRRPSTNDPLQKAIAFVKTMDDVMRSEE